MVVTRLVLIEDACEVNLYPGKDELAVGSKDSARQSPTTILQIATLGLILTIHVRPCFLGILLVCATGAATAGRALTYEVDPPLSGMGLCVRDTTHCGKQSLINYLAQEDGIGRDFVLKYST